MAIIGQISFGGFENMSSIVYCGPDTMYSIGEVYYGLDLVWKTDSVQPEDKWEAYQLAENNSPFAVKYLTASRLLSFSFYTIVDMTETDGIINNAKLVRYDSIPTGDRLNARYMTTVGSNQNMTYRCDSTALRTEGGDPIYKVTYTAIDTDNGIVIPFDGYYVFVLSNIAKYDPLNTGISRNENDCITYQHGYYNLPPEGDLNVIGHNWATTDWNIGEQTQYLTAIEVKTRNIFDDDPIPDAIINAYWDYMNECVTIQSIQNDGADASAYVDHYEYTIAEETYTSTGINFPVSNLDFTGTDKHYTMEIVAVSKDGNSSAVYRVNVEMPVTMQFSSYDAIVNRLYWEPMYNNENYASRVARYIWVCGQYSSGGTTDNYIDCSNFENGTYHAVVSAVTINGNRIKTSYSPDFVVDIDKHVWSYSVTAERNVPVALYTPTSNEIISGYSFYAIYNDIPDASLMVLMEIDANNYSSRTSIASLKVSTIDLVPKMTSDKKYQLFEYVFSSVDGNPIILEAGKTYGFPMPQGNGNYGVLQMSFVRNEETTGTTIEIPVWGILSPWAAVITRTEPSYIQFTYPST